MTPKKNVIKLKTDPVIHFTIIGISSHENDYRLLWSINQQTGLSFSQSECFVTECDKRFARFVHKDEDKRLDLVSNRCENGFLLEKHKNLDFILKFDTKLDDEDTAKWVQDLRKTTLVSTAFHIPTDNKILQLLG